MIKKNFLQKTPAWIKILFLPFINILFFCLPPIFSYSLILVQFICACICRISLKEQISALKPVIYYGILLYFTTFISFLFAGTTLLESLKICFGNKDTLIMLIKLFCVMQSASLLFKTSTAMEIRFGIGKIESSIRKILPVSKKNSFTDTISLFINFIPLVKELWNQSKRSWNARHGKNGVKMYMTLLPVLFSIGLKKAYNTAKAMKIRE